MSATIPAGKRVPTTLQLFDEFDNPAEFDNVPEWVSTDPAIVILEGSDPYSRTLKSVGPLGSVQISVTGGSVHQLVILDDVTTVAGEPVRGTFSYGAVED